MVLLLVLSEKSDSSVAVVTSVGVFINVSCWVNRLNMPKVSSIL